MEIVDVFEVFVGIIREDFGLRQLEDTLALERHFGDLVIRDLFGFFGTLRQILFIGLLGIFEIFWDV